MIYNIIMYKKGNNSLKVHLTPKYFCRLDKSLHLFDTHCAFTGCKSYGIGPLQDPVTWCKITYTGEQVAQRDFQNNVPAFVL